MADEQDSQQRVSILESIDLLSDPYLDKETVVSSYKRLYKEVDTQLDDATNYNDNLAGVLRKVALSEDLGDSDVQTLRQSLFSALIVKEQRLTEEANRKQQQSFPTLGFAESIASVNNSMYRAYEQKKEKNRLFIEKLVDSYSSRLHLTQQQKIDFKEKFVKQIERNEKSAGYRPFEPEEYIKQADTIAASIVPQAEYAKNKAELIRQQIEAEQPSVPLAENQVYSREQTTEQPSKSVFETPFVQDQYVFREIYNNPTDSSVRDAYQAFVQQDRDEELYRELNKKILAHEKTPTIVVPFIALEAATYIVAKEKPHLPAVQILEEAEEQARAFVAVQGAANTISTPELAEAIKVLVKDRNELVTTKQIDGFLQTENNRQLLQEFQRREIQQSLVAIIDHVNDNEFLKKNFGNFVNAPFFTELTRSIKQQASQTPRGSSGLMSMVSGGSKVLSDATNTITSAGTTSEIPVGAGGSSGIEQSPAFHFLLTSDRLMTLSKENPAIYKRLINIVPKETGKFPQPQDAIQTMFALAIASQDPHKPLDIKHFHSLVESHLQTLHSSDKNYLLYAHLHSYLESLLSTEQSQKNVPDGFRGLAQNFVSKTYLVYLFSTHPGFSVDFLPKGLKNLFGQAFSSISLVNFLGKGETAVLSTGATAVLGTGARAGIMTLIRSTNPVVFVASIATSIAGRVLRFVGLGGGEPGEKGRSWGMIGAIAMIPIMLLLMGNINNPSDIERISKPVYIDGVGHGSNFASGESGTECPEGSTNPLCQFEQCKDESAQGGRNCKAPSCGCITQGVNGGYSHAGYNAVDIGIGGGGRAGTCNGELNPVATAPVGGTVIFVGIDDSSYGHFVIIQTSEGYQLLFGHLASFAVKQGDTVGPGAPIGRVNNTGHSSGTHLHFERRDAANGLSANPIYKSALSPVYNSGLPKSAAQNVRSLLPAQSCF